MATFSSEPAPDSADMPIEAGPIAGPPEAASSEDQANPLLMRHEAALMPAARARARVRPRLGYEDDAAGPPPPLRIGGTDDALASVTSKARPPAGTRVLLHSCCAPCSGAMFEEMCSMDLEVTIFFYNPNIHPRKEYVRLWAALLLLLLRPSPPPLPLLLLLTSTVRRATC